jgi:hypothetical protein
MAEIFGVVTCLHILFSEFVFPRSKLAVLSGKCSLSFFFLG